MNENVIPFRIKVNPISYSQMLAAQSENAFMEYPTTAGRAVVALAREKKFDVFAPDGRMNERKLAAILSDRTKRTVHQSTLSRLLKGKLSGKESTLQPIADGFGLTVVEFIRRIRPEADIPPVNTRSLPPEAFELWEVWERIPTKQRAFYLEQMRAAAEFAERFPDLVMVANEQAIHAANAIRVTRQRTKRAPSSS